jgi:nitrilase
MRGGSCIIGPLGQMLAERVFDEDAILTAEIEPGEVARGKYDFDVVGHYARPDVFRLSVNETSQPAVQTNAPAVFGIRESD